jgi:acetyl-CoA synthetase
MYRIVGRVDDVLNVSGHRLGTAEIENAINRAAGVVESAVVGVPHALKGTGIVAFVVTEGEVPEAGSSAAQALQTAVASAVTSAIGPIARPDQIVPVSGLPKTRSGKIMRRILRALAEGRETGFGDVSTLLDPVVVEEIRGRMGGGGGGERG